MAAAPKKKPVQVEVVEPLILAGGPGFLQGTLSLRNPGDERKALRGLKLTPEKPKGRGRRAASPELVVDLPRIKLRAGTSKNVPLNVAVSANTPPGEYAMSLPLDGVEHTARVIVTEVVDLEISPSEVFLGGKKGAKIDKLMVLKNHGNVPVTIPAIGAVQLDLDLLHCRAQRATIKNLKDTDRTWDDVAKAMSLGYEAELESYAPLKVTNDAVTVEAGQTVSQTWTYQLPGKIPTGVEATALIRILSETVTVRILAV